MKFENPFKNRIYSIFIPNVLIITAIFSLIIIDMMKYSPTYSPFVLTPWIQALVGISLILSTIEGYLRGKMSKLAFWGIIAFIICLTISLVFL